MKLLFLTPPMANWLRWGNKHVASNPLHAQLAAYVRQQAVADVAVLDCRALGLSLRWPVPVCGRGDHA